MPDPISLLSLLKMLINEPGKLGRACIAIARLLLSLIVAAKLYTWGVSRYSLMNILDFKQWVNYITTGRMLICLFLLVSSYIFLFHILGYLTTIPLEWISRKVQKKGLDKDIAKSVFTQFQRMEWIHFDPINKIVLSGKNTDQFYALVKEVQKKSTQNRILSLKSSFASDIWHTYFVFSIYYFFVFNPQLPNSLLTCMVLFGFIMITILYWGVAWVIHYFINHSASIEIALEALRMESAVLRAFKEAGVFLQPVPESSTAYCEHLINYQGKEFGLIIKHRNPKRRISKILIDSYLELTSSEGRKLIIITNQRPTIESKLRLETHQDNLILITYESKEEMEEKISSIFQEA